MTARERLQLAYEIAFLPRRQNGFFRGWLNRPALSATAVLSGMVKDVVLPKYRVPEF